MDPGDRAPGVEHSGLGALDDGEGILANAATHKNQLITWALLNLAGAVAAAGVAFMFYPILNRAADTSVKKGLALWYWAPGSLRAVCTSWPCSPPGRPSR